jgi:hypothetical protein
MEDTFAHFDGAYVLGALSESERVAFEEHLIGCADCRDRVAEISDLPALLALAPATAFAPVSAVSDPVVVLLKTVRARRLRRRVFTAAVAAVVAACLVAVTATISHHQSKPTAQAPAVAMAALVVAPIHATAQVTNLAWGTSIKLRCTYDEPDYRPGEYTLTVQNRAGQTDTLGTWNVVPGRVTTFQAGTAFHVSDIKTITIATTNGTPVLQLGY